MDIKFIHYSLLRLIKLMIQLHQRPLLNPRNIAPRSPLRPLFAAVLQAEPAHDDFLLTVIQYRGSDKSCFSRSSAIASRPHRKPPSRGYRSTVSSFSVPIRSCRKTSFLVFFSDHKCIRISIHRVQRTSRASCLCPAGSSRLP